MAACGLVPFRSSLHACAASGGACQLGLFLAAMLSRPWEAARVTHPPGLATLARQGQQEGQRPKERRLPAGMSALRVSGLQPSCASAAACCQEAVMRAAAAAVQVGGHACHGGHSKAGRRPPLAADAPGAHLEDITHAEICWGLPKPGALLQQSVLACPAPSGRCFQLQQRWLECGQAASRPVVAPAAAAALQYALAAHACMQRGQTHMHPACRMRLHAYPAARPQQPQVAPASLPPPRCSASACSLQGGLPRICQRPWRPGPHAPSALLSSNALHSERPACQARL